MQLVWFRQDLRTQDHAALWHARQMGSCIALVIISYEQWKRHDDAEIKIEFYLRQLQTLKHTLNTLNIPLIIQHVPLWEDVPQAIFNLMQALEIKNLHANIEIGVNELKRDHELNKLLEQSNYTFARYHDTSLFPFGSIRNQSDQPYKVFGAFKKICYERLNMSFPPCYPSIESQPALPPHPLWQNSVPIADLPPNHISMLWPVGEHYALEQLDDFIAHKVHYYHNERDNPHLNSTSQISPYLNIGAISIRQCIHALFRDQHGQFHIEHVGQQVWLDELLWREFYLHILFSFPQVSLHQPFKAQTRHIPWRDAPEDLIAWQQGQTGIPIIDAGMRQLLQTGWMHNRVRMITAMFLTKNLLIDWRHGEKWFMQHLIDGNLAANNGGWQWCASTGTDAVPYFRIFNAVQQSKKFDPEGDYIRKWVPELADLDAKSVHEPYTIQPHAILNYPRPIVDLKQSRIRAIDVFKNL